MRDTAASAGRAAGPARAVRSADDLLRVHAGDVLVCRTTHLAWTPLFAMAAAVVTETGGLLCHAAIVVREHGLAAVVAVPGADTTPPHGAPGEVDESAGHVVLVARQLVEYRV